MPYYRHQWSKAKVETRVPHHPQKGPEEMTIAAVAVEDGQDDKYYRRLFIMEDSSFRSTVLTNVLIVTKISYVILPITNIC